MKACEKRPVSVEQVEKIAFDVERELRNQGNSEVMSNDIGEMIMERLADVDEVAYVRFSIGLSSFKDIMFLGMN